mgnify:CR=1 FL=1
MKNGVFLQPVYFSNKLLTVSRYILDYELGEAEAEGFGQVLSLKTRA